MLRFLSKVKIEFNPTDRRSAGALEFLSQCNSMKAMESNPSCEVTIKRRTDDHHPQVLLTFASGHEEVINVAKTNAQKIRSFILEKSRMLEIEQMFKDNDQPWPVLIPEEELHSTAKPPKPKIAR